MYLYLYMYFIWFEAGVGVRNKRMPAICLGRHCHYSSAEATLPSSISSRANCSTFLGQTPLPLPYHHSSAFLGVTVVVTGTLTTVMCEPCQGVAPTIDVLQMLKIPADAANKIYIGFPS